MARALGNWLSEFKAGPSVALVDDSEKDAEGLIRYLTGYSTVHPVEGHSAADKYPFRIKRESERNWFDGVPIRVKWVESREALLRLLEDTPIDIVLIDLHLHPEVPSSTLGLDLISEIYEGFDLAIIAYTSESEDDFGGACYQRGADDFVQKSRDTTSVVRNRVLTQWRRLCEQRSFSSKAATIQLGSWSFTRDNRTVTSADGAAVRLSISEYQFLLFFANNPNAVMDTETFEGLISPPDTTPTEQKMRSFASRLRSKLGTGFPLSNVRGVGYRVELTQ